MKIYVKLEAPFEWVRINAKQVEAFGEVPSLADYPIGDEDTIIGVISGEWVTTHKVDLPAKTRKHFNTALPYALEESISEDVENMHFVCQNWKAGEVCNVSVVAKYKMLEWQALATEHRLSIEQLVADYMLVPFHEAADYSIALYGDKLLSHQRDGYGVSIDKDFLEVCLMELPVNETVAVNDEALTEQLISEYPDRDFRHWPFGSKLSHFLEYKPQLMLDLWGDKYKPKVRRQGKNAFLWPVLCIALAIVIKMAFDSYRYVSMHSEIAEIQTEQKAILLESFPLLDAVASGTEREMMELAIARMGGPDRTKSMHSALADAAKVLRQQKVSLLNIVYRNGELILTCKLNDFSQVDTLTKQFNRTPSLVASLQSSASEDGDVVANYSLRHK
jgi:type II secretion system protein L